MNEAQSTANYLQDTEGNKSSKRLFACILLSTSIVMGIILFSFSLFKSVADAATAKSIIEFFVLVSCGFSVGGTVAENLKEVRK